MVSAAAAARLERASDWLAGRPPGAEVLVVAATAAAASEMVRRAAADRGAAFGWHRATPGRLAAEIAAPVLAERDLVPVGPIVGVAVVARVVEQVGASGSLGRYADIARGPTFARAAGALLGELRLSDVTPEALEAVDAPLAALARAYEQALADAHLTDRAGVMSLAAELVRDAEVAHPWLDLPLLLVDLGFETAVETRLIEALALRSPEVLATAASGDGRAIRCLTERLGTKLEKLAAVARDSSLARLQAHLFEQSTPERTELGNDVVVLSAPGESRECVEIARRLLEHARAGTAFDRMAVLARSPDEYRAHLEDALSRAGIPVHFARGATRPDPAGRAFAALLACRAEDLSAGRFAEYLSLGEVPAAGEGGAPPAAPGSGDRWVAPDEELVPGVVAGALAEPARSVGAADAAPPVDPETVPVMEGTLRAPWRWEQLLVDAAVIGGRERWEKRLDGLAERFRLELREIDDPDHPESPHFEAQLEALASLRAYALPLLDELSALPERAHWGDWLDALSALATRALRRPERVLAVLSELRPMAEVGPVDLAQVQLVLSSRLLLVAEPTPSVRQGHVFVAPAEAARGLCFDVVVVPGLAERLFPRKIAEDPLLLDERRRALAAGLDTNESRVARERLALRLAVGAASDALLLTFPRLDLDQSRPRVPSFYALEALRAAEGVLPGFDELGARAETVSGARVGWPAPDSPEKAIDAAEHDLALLDRLTLMSDDESVGTARYLLDANPHLGRALRFRARRWLKGWTEADGLAKPARGAMATAALEAMADNQLAVRSYSPTALQHFAACPYRFFLQAVHRLAPREMPEAIDEIAPRERGSLVHDVQFRLFGRLGAEGLLPVRPENLERAEALLDEVLRSVADEYFDELAPAIERVWEDGVTGVRADLRRWLQLASEDPSGFVPWRFELAFGLKAGRDRDPHSRVDAVPLACGIRLRGSIDLVERRADGGVRVTDHKTGRVRVGEGDVIAGGESLQPVLYALAAEKIFADAHVESGRLYYCTATGGFEERDVALDDEARRSADTVARVVEGALAESFLPACPDAGACRFCDYKVVCGPYEELRTSRKWQQHEQIAALARLREAR